MVGEQIEILSAEAQLALAYTPADLREALRIFLELDTRIGRIVAATSEPMLGQMRLAWWRDMLGKPVAERPSGDAVLDGIGEHWGGREAALVALVDGWEEMLAEALTREAASKFGEGRAAPFAALCEMAGVEAQDPTGASARRWAFVEAGLHISEGAERETMLALAHDIPPQSPLPKPMRGLAVLDALARRSMKRGARPLMEGRGAALVALRAAILGR